MYIRDWMTSPAITISVESSASSALLLMQAKGVRRLPVVEGDRLVGIITKSNLAELFGPGIPRRRGTKQLLSDVMTRNPVFVAPGDAVETASRILLQRKFSGLPVVENGAVVGVITESDLFRALGRMLGGVGRGTRVEVVVPNDRALVDFLSNQLNKFEILNLVMVPQLEAGGLNVILRVHGRAESAAAAHQSVGELNQECGLGVAESTDFDSPSDS